MKRIAFVFLAALAWLGLGTAAVAQSDFPSRPVKIVVGYVPGASTDIAMRLVADKMSQGLGQTVIVDNKPGAAGLIAAQMVMRAPADGYTLLSFNPDLAGVVPALYKTPPYDPTKDFAYIGRLMRNSGWIMAVNPQLPVHTFDEFLKYAKANKINYGSYGIGSLAHLHFEALKLKTGIDMVHVPYKGGAQSYQAAMANEVQAVIGTSFIELLKSGKLRPLVIGGAIRSPQFPDVPSMAELGYGDQIFGEVYLGLAAPAGTPPAVIARISRELERALALPEVQQRLGQFGDVAYAGPEEFTKIVQRDNALYGPLVRRLGLNTQ
ncbi:MAG TPA: tripartite tricarboxylate transporter substrate binding protein [Ramlibacter sp.]|uniref:Bug family tripartite tricarboxylate transporter substrate binding protein n=1 Tax=Ramlibacter sp. TaxID=1917967 RepID=UPI002C2315F7|nr:tripartite tricarboxylate transporter substrate binding protein [Ramlibacter sp.]HVZ45474.1 tripartite tricarboxylate transporter substrate binding protein [Ramlibacter sp.]